MLAPHIPTGLGAIAGPYDATLCDIWGVIHNGRESFQGACAALQRFQRERGPVVLISNSPRPSPDVIAQMQALGVPDDAWSALVTSGDVTRTLLAAQAPGPAWAIGPERDASLYEGLGLRFTGPETASFISCTGPVDDDVETPEDYRRALSVAARRNLLMICANPDRIVQRGDKLIYCGGALAELYETLGGAVVMAGKPHAPIYNAALTAADRLAGRAIPRKRVLAIGDGLSTDIAGANRQGLDVLFIAGGVHAADVAAPRGGLNSGALGDALGKDRLDAAYALAALAW
jgi:HAD superfamily hydrolase (TIGR01459 family)